MSSLAEDVSDDRISQVLSTAESAARACMTLVTDANRAGGTDNITVVAAALHGAA